VDRGRPVTFRDEGNGPIAVGRAGVDDAPRRPKRHVDELPPTPVPADVQVRLVLASDQTDGPVGNPQYLDVVTGADIVRRRLCVVDRCPDETTRAAVRVLEQGVANCVPVRHQCVDSEHDA